MLLFTFYLIFSFSAEDGTTSKRTSEVISEFILNNFTDYKNMSETQAKEVLKATTKVIRKLAHYCIYIIVGMLLMGIGYTFYNIGDGNKFLFSQGFGIVYATSDEIHQLFVDGRSGEIKDVMLDSFGVFTGILITIMIVKIYRIIKNKNKK